MTLSDAVKLWPQIQAAFAAAGVPITLGQALDIYPTIAALLKGSAAAPAPSAPTIPTTLTLGADANLAPYGVALVGFSPQDHQGENLRDPQHAKYIAYAYLVANQIPPAPGWAARAVSVLAAAVPDVDWKAVDGEHLLFHSQIVHTAPRGKGDPTLLHRDDLNAVEFLWVTIDA